MRKQYSLVAISCPESCAGPSLAHSAVAPEKALITSRICVCGVRSQDKQLPRALQVDTNLANPGRNATPGLNPHDRREHQHGHVNPCKTCGPTGTGDAHRPKSKMPVNKPQSPKKLTMLADISANMIGTAPMLIQPISVRTKGSASRSVGQTSSRRARVGRHGFVILPKTVRSCQQTVIERLV